jgi:negative regulator of sigma E activity
MKSRGGRAAGTLLMLGVLCMASPGGTSPSRVDADQLLLASEQADRKVSYSGTKVLRFYRPEDGSLAAERVVKVWHRDPSQTRLEMVTPAEILGMVVLENGESVWVFHPRKQSWRQMTWRAPDARPHLLLRNYDAKVLRREKIAGRAVYVVRLTSRNPGNPSKVVWIDRETKLALRQELFDPSGRKLSTSEFREIAFEGSLPSNLFSVPAEARIEPRREGAPPWAGQKAGAAHVVEQPRYVPAGYELVQRFCMKRRDREFAHLRYTDGLNTISLFIERACGPGGEAHNRQSEGVVRDHGQRGGPGGREGREPRPGEHGQRLTVQRGDTRYTLVGNISLKELRRMADSISAPAEPSRETGAAAAGARWKR